MAVKKEHIRSEPTSSCKLQSGPPNQHLRGCARGVGGGIRKSVIRVGVIVKLLNPPCSLDVDQVAQIEVCVGCKKRLICT